MAELGAGGEDLLADAHDVAEKRCAMTLLWFFVLASTFVRRLAPTRGLSTRYSRKSPSAVAFAPRPAVPYA